MSKQSNVEAGIEFAKLVFAGKYKAPLVNGEGETVTKKEAKKISIDDAINAVEQGCEANSLAAIAYAADLYFSGRRESGPFGSVLLARDYKKSMGFYEKLLAREDVDNDHLCCAYLRLGTLSNLIKNPETKEDWEPAIFNWEKAMQFGGNNSHQASYQLARYHYYIAKDYAVAIPLLDSVFATIPYASFVLGQAYKNGFGVEKNLDKYKQFTNSWKENAEAQTN